MTIRFRDFELDEERYVLEHRGRRVPLRPKAFDLLAHLLRHHARVVRREELIEEVWGTTCVGEGALSGLVNEVRQALGEEAGGDSSIRTVHARGYQFVAPIEGTAPPLLVEESARAHADVLDLPRRVAEEGARGLVIAREDGAAISEGVVHERPRVELPILLERMIEGAEALGFEIQMITPPTESMAPAGRLALDLIDAARSLRGDQAVFDALPLAARHWLRDPPKESVAGGISPTRGGPVGGMTAATAMLARLATRRPILLVLDELDRAGRAYASDLARLCRRLENAPVLLAAVVPSRIEDLTWRRLLESGGGFEFVTQAPRSRRAPSRLAEISNWLRARGIDPLPASLETQLLDHLGGAPERVLELLSRAMPKACSDDSGGAKPAHPVRRMRRVEPLQGDQPTLREGRPA